MGNNRRYVWRDPTRAFWEKNLVPTAKHGGGSIRICVYFVAAGTGEIVRIDGTMDLQDTKRF